MTEDRIGLSDEELAAFIDGRLPPAQRESVIRRLDRSPDDYRRLVEVLRSLDRLDGVAELSPQTASEPGGAARRQEPSTVWTWKRPAAWILAAAAAVLLLVVSPMIVSIWRSGGGVSAERLAERLTRESSYQSLADSVWRESTSGLGFAGLRTETAGFRLGRLSVDLWIAAESARGDLLAELVGEHTVLLERSERFGSAWSQLAQQRGADPERIKSLLRTADRESESQPYFGFGKWTESGRLAAGQRLGGFFQEAGWSRFLGEFEAARPETTVSARLEEVRRLSVRSDRSEREWLALERSLVEIIRSY